MKNRKFVSIGSAILTVAFLWAVPAWAVEEVTVDPWFVETIENNQAILQPGTTTYCNKDFEVENMGKEMAEVRIIRGNGDNYDTDQIPSGGKLGYKLQDRSIFATGASEGNWVDEARIVNSTLGEANLKIHCK
jgi:aconitase A